MAYHDRMATNQERVWLSAAETAKLVRQALKAEFPGQKFSVRSKTYSGGASITAAWTDGPISKEVDAVLSLYEGATFDGMIDLKSTHDSLLMTDDGPQVVHFGADFVHASRTISAEWRELLTAEVEFFAGEKIHGGKMDVSARDGQLARDTHQGEWGDSLPQQLGWGRRRYGDVCPSSNVESAYPDARATYCPMCNAWIPVLHGRYGFHLR